MARSVSCRVKPASVLRRADIEAWVAMLKPLERSSSISGETPVTNIRPTAPERVPALSAA